MYYSFAIARWKYTNEANLGQYEFYLLYPLIAEGK